MKQFFLKYKYLLWFLYVPVYIISFFLIEKIIGNDHAIWSTVLPVDDMIPFWEWAVIPYSTWYPLMLFMAVYLAATDKRAFSRYMCYLTIGFSLCMVFCLIVPNGTSADFRPDLETLGRSNAATWILGNVIWKNDTFTNVIPSIHIVGTFMVIFGYHDSKLTKNKLVGFIIYFMSILITASTVLTKQHALLDIIVGAVYSFIIYFVVYFLIRKAADKKYQKTEKE